MDMFVFGSAHRARLLSFVPSFLIVKVVAAAIGVAALQGHLIMPWQEASILHAFRVQFCRDSEFEPHVARMLQKPKMALNPNEDKQREEMSYARLL